MFQQYQQKQTNDPNPIEATHKPISALSTRSPAWTSALGSQPALSLQPKLSVNETNDKHKQEDDQDATVGRGGANVDTAARTGPTWTKRGGFEWKVRFGIDKEYGAIVQKIENTFVSDKPAAQGWIPTSVYWERWGIGINGRDGIDKSGNDDWIRLQQPWFSKGRWSMKGTVYYSKDGYGGDFRANAVPDASQLEATTNDPGAAYLGRPLMIRTANGEWKPTKKHNGQADELQA